MGEKAKKHFDDKRLMLAHTYDPLRVVSWKRGVTIEPKLDGIRCVCLVKPDPADKEAWIIDFYSRNGRQLDMFDHMFPQIIRFVDACYYHDHRFSGGAMIDGEMLSDSGSFADIAGAIHRKKHTHMEAAFAIFHAMPLELWKKGSDDYPQYVRRDMINLALQTGRDMAPLSTLQTHKVYSDKDVQRFYKQFFDVGLTNEGAMIKDSIKPWKSGRSYVWMKLKAINTVDVRVKDIEEGQGKYAGTLGFLVFKYKGKIVTCGGMTDAQRDDWWRHPKKIVGRMIEVKYNGETETGSLRFPRFGKLRPDKD